MIAAELLSILVCPETHQPVSFADANLIEALNKKIAAKTLANRSGALVTEPVDAGLLRKDGKVLYPVRNDIPIMLIDEAIPLP